MKHSVQTRNHTEERARKRGGWCIAVAAAVVLIVAAIVLVGLLFAMRCRAMPSAAGPSTSWNVADNFLALLQTTKGEAPLDATVGQGKGNTNDEFPQVDWDYWKSVNPDVVGWLTVPGTTIDLPIAQAPAADPDYYLSHDVYGDRNFYGCSYLDATCDATNLLSGGNNSAEKSLDNNDAASSPNSVVASEFSSSGTDGPQTGGNAVVFGHNMSEIDGGMFTTFASYSSEDFARTHNVVLLQTPTEKVRLEVAGARVVPGQSATKRTIFANQTDLSSYVQECLQSCDVLLPAGKAALAAACRAEASPASAGPHLFTFVTCSYTHYENERTLVYAVPNQ